MTAGVDTSVRTMFRAAPSREGDRVTTIELFFDLAFVFAFTQLTGLMAHEHNALGVVQALGVMALLWWSWTAYGWLSNLAHADEGVVRIAMIVGMIAVFVAGLGIRETFDDLPGGVFAPMVFVSAYLVARVAHGIVFTLLSEPALRRRTVVTVILSVVPSGVLLTVGAFVGGPGQLWCTLAAVAVEPLAAYRMSLGIEWPVRSITHFTERHGLIMILALGETTLGIGVGVASEPLSEAILAGVVLSMLICVGMWWAYFTRLAKSAERTLRGLPSVTRAHTATDAYTYLHLVLIGGIVLAALGLEVAMAHIDATEHYGLFGATALAGGVACYLAGTALFAHRMHGQWNGTRLTLATALVLAIPAVAALTPMAALAIVAAVLVGLNIVEQVRARVEQGQVERPSYSHSTPGATYASNPAPSSAVGLSYPDGAKSVTMVTSCSAPSPPRDRRRRTHSSGGASSQ
jgi:low temperature requirement protein LtrA